MSLIVKEEEATKHLASSLLNGTSRIYTKLCQAGQSKGELSVPHGRISMGLPPQLPSSPPLHLPTSSPPHLPIIRVNRIWFSLIGCQALLDLRCRESISHSWLDCLLRRPWGSCYKLQARPITIGSESQEAQGLHNSCFYKVPGDATRMLVPGTSALEME